MLLDIRPDYLQLVKAILQKHVPQYEVWAFGSRAKWTAKEYSDLDLCVVSDQPLSFKVLGAMAEDFSESDLPWKVDIVDWATTSASFRKIIERDKVVVQAVCQVSPSDHAAEMSGCANLTYGVGWQLTTLGRICEAQGGAIQTGPFGSQLHTSDYQEFGVPVVMPTNIGDGGIIEDGIARIGHADVARLSQHKLRLGDIIFSRRGDVTKNALIRPHEVGWLCGTGCLKVRLNDESIANAKFISHCLRLPKTKEWLVRHAVGATMPNLNTGILSDVPIHLPPLKEQLEIAETLGALDDRIAMLRETNATLEGIAHALFKSWFVDFDPVHAKQQGIAPAGMDETTAALFPDGFEESELGLVPRGWKVERLETFMELAYGKALKATERIVGDVPVYGSGGITGYHNESLVNGPSIVIGRKGTVGSLYWEDQPFFPIDTVFYVRSAIPLTFCFYLLQTLGLADMNTDAAVPGLNRNNVYRLKVPKPPESVLSAFGDVVDALRASILRNNQQAQTLATLRDTLLPRLISGQLRLSAAMLDEVKA